MPKREQSEPVEAPLAPSLYVAPWLLADPFCAADIRQLAGVAGMPMAAVPVPEDLAKLLGQCFKLFVVHELFSQQNASERAIRYAEIKEAAERFLDALGARPGQQGGEFEAAFVPLVVWPRLFGGDSNGVLGTHHLVDTIKVVALIAGIAARGYEHYAPRVRAGRPRCVFHDFLFPLIATFHYFQFGNLPEIETEPGERNGRSIPWAQAVLQLAAERIPPLICLDLVAQLRKAAALSEATLAAKLAKANSELRRSDKTVAETMASLLALFEEMREALESTRKLPQNS